MKTLFLSAISKEEVTYAIRTTKQVETVDPDEISTEITQLIDDFKLQVIVSLFNTIYEMTIYLLNG